nr:unnamed protein product [Callosobruchus analis]
MSRKKKHKDDELSSVDTVNIENDISKMEQEIYFLKEIIETKNNLISEKDKYISQLLHENKRLQEHYELLINNIVEKDSIITSLEKINNRIEKIEESSNKKLSYAEATLMNKPTKKPMKTLVIKPHETQLIQETQKDLKNNINLSNINVRIDEVKTSRNGSVEILLHENHFEKLQNEVQEKLQTKYRIFEKRPLYPKIKIIGYTSSDQPNEDLLVKDIVNQNKFINPDDIKITFIQWNQIKKNYNIFAEIKGNVYKIIKEERRGKILVGFQNLLVFDNNQITQCKKCKRFNHQAKSCRNQTNCSKCGEEHEESKCTEGRICCSNCKYANEKYRKNYDTKHSSTDRECPSFKYMEEQHLSKIDF